MRRKGGDGWREREEKKRLRGAGFYIGGDSSVARVDSYQFDKWNGSVSVGDAPPPRKKKKMAERECTDSSHRPFEPTREEDQVELFGLSDSLCICYLGAIHFN
jgi:hypothetical protein